MSARCLPCTLLLLAAAATSPLRGATYNVQEVGWAGNTVYARDINDRGQVVGVAYHIGGGARHAFLWQNGQAQDLGTLPSAASSEAWALNNSAQVVGQSGGRAFLWDKGTMSDLGMLPPDFNSTARGINSTGQVAGTSYIDGQYDRAFLWENGTMSDLGGLGGTSTRANAINDLGHVVGTSALSPSSQVRHAFLWEEGVMRDLGSLGDWAEAWDINNNGQAVGHSWGGTTQTQVAFIWENGVMRSLGTGWAYGISDAGDAVGVTWPGGASRAVMWRAGQTIDLTSLLPANSGWTLYGARAINKVGQIIGAGSYNGRDAAFLMTPIPEPSALVGLCVALAGLAVFRRR